MRLKLNFPKTTLKWIVIGVVIVLILLERCKREANISNDLEAIANYKDTVMEMRSKNGQLISYNEALKLSSASSKRTIDFLELKSKELSEQLKTIKKPTSVNIVKTDTRIDSVVYTFRDTIPCVFHRTISIDSPHYYFEAELDNKRFFLTQMHIENEQNIVVGNKKNGLFKKPEYVISVTNTNPHVNVSGLQSYNFKPKSFPLSLGVGVQYGLNVPNMQPALNIGVSLHYKIRLK